MINHRGIIHVGGSPGSGKSRLATAVADKLRTDDDIIAEHLSLGNRLRHIGRGTIESMYRQEIAEHLFSDHASIMRPNEIIITNILHEALEESNQKGVEVVLLDGYPRYPDQIEQLQFLSIITNYALLGSITTLVDEQTALARILKRSRDHADRRLSEADAHAKLTNYYDHNFDTMRKIGTILPRESIHYVETNGAPADSAELGYRAVRNILDQQA